MGMKSILAKPEHEVAYQDIVQLVRKHADKITPLEMLAIAANMVGKLIAFQDQRVITPAVAVEIIAENVECGNQQALEKTLGETKGSA